MIYKLKEMEYSDIRERCFPILAHGTFEGRHFFILSISGNHPCAYVEEFRNEDFYFDRRLGEIVHGGITFQNSLSHVIGYYGEPSDKKIDSNLCRTYIGWDYDHYGDYAPYREGIYPENFIELKKWSVDEILEEIKEAIHYMNYARKGRKKQ